MEAETPAIIDLMPERNWEIAVAGLTVTFQGPRCQFYTTDMALTRGPEEGRPDEVLFEFTPHYEVLIAPPEKREIKDPVRAALCCLYYHLQYRYPWLGVYFTRKDMREIRRRALWPYTAEECALQMHLLKHSD